MGIKTVDIKNKVTARLKHVAGAWGYGIFDTDNALDTFDDFSDRVVEKYYKKKEVSPSILNNLGLHILGRSQNLWQKPLKVGDSLVEKKDVPFTEELQKKIADYIQKEIKRVFPYAEKMVKSISKAEKILSFKKLSALLKNTVPVM